MTELERLRSLMKTPDSISSHEGIRADVNDTSIQLIAMDDDSFQELMAGVDVAELPEWCKNTLLNRARMPKGGQ